VSTPSSTAISMARFQCLTAACRSTSSVEAQRYIGSSEAMPTPLDFSDFLKLRSRSGKTRGALNHSRKSARGLSSIHS
jgi:hypothetical protein